MKIVQVSAVDSTMNKLLRELNDQIIKAGHELICVCSDGPNVEEMRKRNYDVRPVHIERSIKPLSNLKSIWEMFKLLRKEKPDIVHVHTPVAALLGRIAAKFARVPNIIYTAHGFYFHENMSRRKYKFFFTIEKIAAKLFTDYIFTQSQEDGKLAIDKGFLPKGKITVISNGVDVKGKFNPENIKDEKVSKLREELNINEEDKVITFVGRLVKEKGIFELLEAIKRIEKNNCKLLIIGGASATTERDQVTNEKLEKYHTLENVIFTGHRKDIPELLYLTDVFCLPSYREGMPRSIIEAMAMECAIVATNIRGSREEVDSNVNGLLVPVKSADALSKSLNDVISDEEKLIKYKLNSRMKAESQYDEDVVVKKQLNLFSKIEKS